MSILIEEVANRQMAGECGLSFHSDLVTIPVSCWADAFVVTRAVDRMFAVARAARVGATADAGGFAHCWTSSSGAVLDGPAQMPVAELLSMRVAGV